MTCGQNPGGRSVGRSYGRSNDKYPPSMCRDISNRFINFIKLFQLSLSKNIIQIMSIFQDVRRHGIAIIIEQSILFVMMDFAWVIKK